MSGSVLLDITTETKPVTMMIIAIKKEAKQYSQPPVTMVTCTRCNGRTKYISNFAIIFKYIGIILKMPNTPG